MVRFSKYEGLGNHFVVLDESDATHLDADLVRAICAFRTGVGGDGVLVVRPGAAPGMRVFNADGTQPEMCGNGLRCAVRYLADRGLLAGSETTFETDAGPHRTWLHEDGTIEIDMRQASLDPQHIPLDSAVPWVDTSVNVGGDVVALTAVSMGNPHVVVFEVDGPRRRKLAALLDADRRFPAGVNVGFAKVTGSELALAVHERGVGWTAACGTGACAAVVAAHETGRLPRGLPVTVRLPGGGLTITASGAGAPLRMRGPARKVFEGEVDLDALRRAAAAS